MSKLTVILNKFYTLYNLISLRDIMVVFLLNTLGAVLNAVHYLLVDGASLSAFYANISEYIKVYNLLGFALVLSYLLLSPGPDARLSLWRLLSIGGLAFAICLPVSFLLYPWDGRIVHPLIAASSYIMGKLLLSAWAIFAIIYIKRRESQLQFQYLRNQINETTEQRDKAELELHLLQAQLEPHFFFNTLANLHNLIDIDGERAKLLLEELTSYLRSTIPQFRQRFISLHEELEIVRRYLNIQKIRYGHKLSFDIQADEQATQQKVLPMAILCLVENAIKHGIEKSRYGGSIEVRAQIKNNRLHIAVTDDVALLQAAQPGTGVTNLLARLDKVYAGRALFNICTLPGLTLAQLEFRLMTNLIVADDEPILLDSLAHKLNRFWPQASILARCLSGEEALEAIESEQVQVAFLDIQMGSMSGIDVALACKKHCHFVFVTAFDQYAVSAFETGAIDYLLKPYSDERLQACITRVQQRLHQMPDDISLVLQSLKAQVTPEYLKRLKVQIGNRIWLIAVADILYLQAAGRYVKVVTKEREALLRTPLKSLLSQLDPELFWQIHRSIVINLNHLDHVNASEPEQLQVYIKGISTALPVSRSAQHLFRQLPESP